MSGRRTRQIELPDAPDAARVIDTSRGDRRSLGQEIADTLEGEGFFVSIKNKITSWIDGYLSQPEEAQNTVVSFLLKLFISETEEAERQADTGTSGDSYTGDELPPLQSRILQIPSSLESFTSNITQSGWYNFNGTPTYIEYNSTPSDARDKHIKIPQQTMQYLVNEGYRINGGQSIQEFIETRLLTTVRLPSTFTGNLSLLRVNRRIARQLDFVFRQMERERISYNIESVGTYSFRNTRGPGASGLLSNHALGTAIDFNARVNRYAEGLTIEDADFDQRFVDIFKAHGFDWGGKWGIPDLMHFEKPITGTDSFV